MAYKKIGLVAVMDVSGFLPNVTKFINSIDQMNKTVKDTSSSTGKMAGPISAVGSALGTLSIIAGAIVSSQIFASITNGLKDIVKEAARAAETFQLLEQRFATLAARDYMRATGASMQDSLNATTDAAKETIEWVRQLSVTTPYTVESLSKMSAYAQAAGFTGKEVKNLAQTIGDFSAGMGLSSEHVDRIIWNFSQMMSAGRVLGRELRDLGNSMVPVDYIIEKLAVEFDVTKTKMKEMLQSGEVDARKFIDTFNQMSAEEFAGAMERLSNTLPFAKANLKDFIDTMLGLDVLKPTFDELGRLLNEFLKVLMQPDARRATAQFGFALRESFLMIVDAIKTQVLPAIRTFFEALGMHQPTVTGITKGILNLGFAFKLVSQIFSIAVRAISKVIGAILDLFKPLGNDLAKKTYGWGGNAILQFAKGIASAIGFVLKALAGLARAITKILKSNSPPLLLPDIDKWGANTMTAYIEGWANADFSTFDKLGDMIKKYIDAFVDLDKEDAIARILGGRAAIAEVISQFDDLGEASSAAIDSITDASGISNETLTKYIEALFKLNEISQDSAMAQDILGYSLGDITLIGTEIVTSLEQVIAAAQEYSGIGEENILAYVQALQDQAAAQLLLTDAQNELNDVTEYYSAILADLNDQQNELNDKVEDTTRIREIDRTLQKVILTAAERERLELEKRGILLKREIRDTEAARDAAVGSAEDKVSAAEEAIKMAESMAKAQQDMAKAVIESTKMQIEAQVELYKSLLDILLENMGIAAGGMGAALGGGLSDAFEDMNFDLSSLWEDTDYTSITEGVEEAVNEMFLELQEKWEHFSKDLLKPFKDLQVPLDDLVLAIGELNTALDPFKTKVGDVKLDWETIGKIVVGIIVGVPILKFGAFIITKGAAVAKGIVNIAKALGAWRIAGTTGPMVLLLVGAFALLIAVFKKWGPEAQNTIFLLGDVIRGSFVILWNNMTALYNRIKENMRLFWIDLKAKISEGAAKVGEAITEFVNNAKIWFTDKIKEPFEEGVGIVKTTIEQLVFIVEDIFTRQIPEKIEAFKTKVKETWDQIITNINLFKDDLVAKAQEILDNVHTFFTVTIPEKWEEFKTKVGDTWDTVVENMTNFKDDLVEKAQEVLDNVIQFFTVDIPAKWEEFKTTTEEKFDAVYQKLVDFKDDVAAKAQEILDTIVTFFTVDIPAKFEEFKTLVGEKLTGIKETIDDKWQEMVDAATQFGKDIIQGVIDGLVSKSGELYAKVRSIIQSAIDWANRIGETGSPSKVFTRVGKSWMDGLSQGMAKNAYNSLKNIAQIASPSKLFGDISKNWMLGLSKGVDENTASVHSSIARMMDITTGKLDLQVGSVSNSIVDKLNTLYASSPKSSYSGATGNTTNNSKIVNLTINPTYEQYASKSTIYYDVKAALAASGR